jgi:hypothetical protein
MARDEKELWNPTTGCDSGRLLRAARPTDHYLKHVVRQQRGAGGEFLASTLAGCCWSSLENSVKPALRDAIAAVAATTPSLGDDVDGILDVAEHEDAGEADGDNTRVRAVCGACGQKSAALPVHFVAGKYLAEPACLGAIAERTTMVTGVINLCRQHRRPDLLEATSTTPFTYDVLSLATGARRGLPAALAADLAQNFADAWGEWSIPRRRELDLQLAEQSRSRRNARGRAARAAARP